MRVNNVLDVTKNNGNVERQTISFTGLNAQQSYTYDALNRFKTMSELGGWSQTYSYDRFGNRWVSGGNVPSPQQTPQTQTAFDASSNKINSAVMIGFSYDPVGNLTSDPTTPVNGITYDGENRQTSYMKSGVGTTTYSYDGDGRRVKKVTGSPAVTTIYVYDAMGKLVAEYNDAQQQPAGGTKYLTTDHLGSTRVVTGQNQAVVARYDYLPFGEEIGAGVGSRTAQMGYGLSDSTRQKFTSKERDTESGLDYFLARYYSSAQGRFTNVDPFDAALSRQADANRNRAEEEFLKYLNQPQHWNRYPYVLNNPLRYVDENGEQELDSIKKAISRVSLPGPVSPVIVSNLTVRLLNWMFGPNIETIPGGLAAKEIDFAKEIAQFTRNTFIGVNTKNEPGIDGVLTSPGTSLTGYSDVKGVVSLTETQHQNPMVLLDLSKEKETQAGNGGYKQVDLFIKATGLDSATVAGFAQRGPGFTNVIGRGVIRSINIFTNDGKVVKIDSNKVTVCGSGGECP